MTDEACLGKSFVYTGVYLQAGLYCCTLKTHAKETHSGCIPGWGVGQRAAGRKPWLGLSKLSKGSAQHAPGRVTTRLNDFIHSLSPPPPSLPPVPSDLTEGSVPETRKKDRL